MGVSEVARASDFRRQPRGVLAGEKGIHCKTENSVPVLSMFLKLLESSDQFGVPLPAFFKHKKI